MAILHSYDEHVRSHSVHTQQARQKTANTHRKRLFCATELLNLFPAGVLRR